MEQNNDWVEDRLAELNPEVQWKPEVAAARERFEGRRARGRFPVRWTRVLPLAALAAICSLTFPQPRALAARVIEPCVEACQNLVSSPADMHDHVHQLMWTVHNFLGIAPPNFALTDAAGVNFRLSDYMGKVVVLSFWATWCKPCQAEIPWFEEFERTYADRGFAVVAVSLDEDGWKSVRPLIDSRKINYRVAVGDHALANQYGAESLPLTLVLNRKGGVVAKHAGIVSRDEYETEILHALGRE